MNPIHRDAILMASKIRRQLKVNQFQPINIFEACMCLNIVVQFVDFNMEGFYAKVDGIAKILISNKRPLPRRCFTAAHELGHFAFNHGLKVDILTDESSSQSSKDDDEILVDAFAAAILMPVGGIQAEFAKRGWKFEKQSPIDYYIISSLFGVGYQTLILHCRYSNLIDERKLIELQKVAPAKILRSISTKIAGVSHLKIIDEYCSAETVDLEVSNYIVLPPSIVESEYLQKIEDCAYGCIYLVLKSGITSIHFANGTKSLFLRIQKENYIGYAEYRYLEN